MSRELVELIGATDQSYLKHNSPELALQRGDLRLQLVAISVNRQEQIHFLHEAIVILEQSRLEFDEMPWPLYLDLSLHLARAYMIYYELSHELKFATISQQILKPLAHHQEGDVFLWLAYASAVKQELALSQHWLHKYARSTAFDAKLLMQHSAFARFHHQPWFKALFRSKLS
jgi:hypothetical protein